MFGKIIKEGVLFERNTQMWRVLYRIEEKGGLMAKLPSPSSPLALGNRGRRGLAGGGLGPVVQGARVAGA